MSGFLQRTRAPVVRSPLSGNLLLNPNFDATWTGNMATLTNKTGRGPNGLPQAGRLIEDGTAATSHNASQTVTKAASIISYSLTVHAKQAVGDRHLQSFCFNSDFSAGAWVGANLTTGATLVAAAGFGAFASISGSVTRLRRGWFKVNLLFTSTAHTSLLINPGMHNGTSDTYSGDSTSGIYLWGADLRVV